jgi:hypothetical protein
MVRFLSMKQANTAGIRQNPALNLNNSHLAENDFPFSFSVILLYPQVIHDPINKPKSKIQNPTLTRSVYPK